MSLYAVMPDSDVSKQLSVNREESQQAFKQGAALLRPLTVSVVDREFGVVRHLNFLVDDTVSDAQGVEVQVHAGL